MYIVPEYAIKSTKNSTFSCLQSIALTRKTSFIGHLKVRQRAFLITFSQRRPLLKSQIGILHPKQVSLLLPF